VRDVRHPAWPGTRERWVGLLEFQVYRESRPGRRCLPPHNEPNAYKPTVPRSIKLTPLLLMLVMMAAGVRVSGAAPVRTAHVEAELVAERTALVPGRTNTVALRLVMERGWHTYWQNPGDSGLPTTLAWKLPEGLSAGPIQWPAPRALPVGPLVNYGYEGQVLLLNDITTVPDFLSGKTVTLSARADWLVCKEICIPEGADLTLTLPVIADGAQVQPDSRWSDAIAKARTSVPRAVDDWKVTATGRGPKIELRLAPASGHDNAPDLAGAHFFPYVEGQIEASGAQPLTREGAEWSVSLPVASQRVGEFKRVAGVLVSGDAGAPRAVSVDVPLGGTVVAGSAATAASVPSLQLMPPASSADSALSLGTAIFFALIGGVLLNLMPCVFPVLSLKVLGFATHRESGAAMRHHGLAFGAGVLVSFWLLAGALIALRAAGQQLGWGFQLQSPTTIACLAVLFFVLALNLSGVFEVSQFVPSSLATWNAKNPLLNDALSGALAVVVASPCSAPFMGAALGYALAGPMLSTWIVFTVLAVGMALPYALLAYFPAWRKRLPKPGAWMERLKHLLAFPLYATVLWLLWVLGAQLDNDAVLRLGVTLLLIALGLWAWQTMRTGGARGWGIASAASIVSAIVVGWPVVATSALDAETNVSRRPADDELWQDYSAARVAELVAAGRPVFVEFTAAWCVTCQVNKRLVLDTDAVREAFARQKVALLQADWTRRDPAIGAALAALGRDGVPVYVFFRPGKEPLLLPEVLRKQNILDAVDMPQAASSGVVPSTGG
jgi:thiol:disulfide interchange protein/DsbC/DsbD-like thiol-disulfide interchange protein